MAKATTKTVNPKINSESTTGKIDLPEQPTSMNNLDGFVNSDNPLPKEEKPFKVAVEKGVLVDHTVKSTEVINIEKSPIENSILKYVAGNKEKDFTLNDYLKNQLGEKYNVHELMRTLVGLVNAGKLVIEDDAHLKLGECYWNDGEPETQHHNLDTVELVVKK